METKIVHSTIKCKVCQQVKNRYFAGKYPSGKDSRYIDDAGKEWNGHCCGVCHKSKVGQRKRNNAKVRAMLKELENE